MPKKAIPTVRDQGDLFQRDVKNILDDVSRVAISKGVLIEGVELTTGTTGVSHGLSRQPKGWMVVDITADARVRRDPAKTTGRTSHLYLIATADCTVSLWIF